MNWQSLVFNPFIMKSKVNLDLKFDDLSIQLSDIDYGNHVNRNDIYITAAVRDINPYELKSFEVGKVNIKDQSRLTIPAQRILKSKIPNDFRPVLEISLKDCSTFGVTFGSYIIDLNLDSLPKIIEFKIHDNCHHYLLKKPASGLKASFKIQLN